MKVFFYTVKNLGHTDKSILFTIYDQGNNGPPYFLKTKIVPNSH